MSMQHEIANMEAIKTAIANGEENRVKQLLTDQVLDELQKSYLIDLAEVNGNQNIINMLKDAPAKP
ncbi:hypothetical protein OCL06_08290 [Alteromonas sp. ASW11-19]|uniref:Uncharacterized protein n=1 Tax=Alteromonas salexigens TaxID=2982530 RepID=A0ABT2VMR4_9ALTE|nr:hypothetical protein [Alteromonas salexigens]MCU7554596.1 hypothetical protein [Alteromonas salexigens]